MTTRAENQRRINNATAWLLEGHSTQVVVTKLVESEGVQRRTAHRICRSAWKNIHQDVEQTDISNTEMTAKLIHLLEAAAAKGLQSGNVGATVAAIRELNGMLGLGMHNRRPNGYGHGWRR